MTYLTLKLNPQEILTEKNPRRKWSGKEWKAYIEWGVENTVQIFAWGDTEESAKANLEIEFQDFIRSVTQIGEVESEEIKNFKVPQKYKIEFENFIRSANQIGEVESKEIKNLEILQKYRKVIARLLEIAGNQFVNHGCNDFDLESVLPDLNDRQELAQLIADEDEVLDPNDKFECMFDWRLMEFFASVFDD
jgi:hypothetical protein